MARPSLLQVLRARIGDLPRPPAKLGLLVVADALDMAGSAAFMAMSPPPVVTPRGPGPLLDVPHVAAPISTGVAALGLGLALLLTIEIVIELSWLYRRMQLDLALRRPARSRSKARHATAR
ncbi:MAG: hypothetical protein U0359_41155 [Byssovorax sp.]